MIKKLKSLRVEHKFTQKEIAELLNISKTGYASWEQGLSEPNSQYLIRLANIYKCSVDYILDLENEDFTIEYNNSLSSITSEEVEILDLYRSLNDDGKEIAKHYLENLQEINAIKKFG